MARTNNTSNRGTQIIDVPIQFHIGASRLNWEIVHESGTALFVGSLSDGALEYIELNDAWELVRRYLKLRADDEESILEFLAIHGWFEAPEGSKRTKLKKNIPTPIYGARPPNPSKPSPEPFPMVVETFSLQEFVTVQDYVRRMLLEGNPTLPTPWRNRVGPQEYTILFTKVRSGSRAVVKVGGTFPSILATVQFKLAQGATLRTCARKDCRLPFEVTSLHKRRFCTQYCAHITSLRQRRKLEGKRRKQSIAGATSQFGGSNERV